MVCYIFPFCRAYIHRRNRVSGSCINCDIHLPFTGVMENFDMDRFNVYSHLIVEKNLRWIRGYLGFPMRSDFEAEQWIRPINTWSIWSKIAPCFFRAKQQLLIIILRGIARWITRSPLSSVILCKLWPPMSCHSTGCQSTISNPTWSGFRWLSDYGVSSLVAWSLTRFKFRNSSGKYRMDSRYPFFKADKTRFNFLALYETNS